MACFPVEFFRSYLHTIYGVHSRRVFSYKKPRFLLRFCTFWHFGKWLIPGLIFPPPYYSHFPRSPLGLSDGGGGVFIKIYKMNFYPEKPESPPDSFQCRVIENALSPDAGRCVLMCIEIRGFSPAHWPLRARHVFVAAVIMAISQLPQILGARRYWVKTNRSW